MYLPNKGNFQIMQDKKVSKAKLKKKAMSEYANV